MKLFPFIGGVHPPQHKRESDQHPVRLPRLPERLVLPLSQHIGAPAEPLVEPGQKVLKGERIARASDYVSAPIHAPTSGTIMAVVDEVVPHPSGMKAPCIVLDADGEDRWCELTPHMGDYQDLEPGELRRLLRQAGIVGLGGAGFPSYIKLNPGPNRRLDTLILNGAECEPYITCDEMLMRERPQEIIGGLLLLRHALQAKNCIIAIEDNKPEAIAAMREALAAIGAGDIRLQPVPTIYPAGGEKQLIHTLTGKEVPKHGLPIHVGVLCHNVGTSAAIYRAIYHGEPVISRFVTVTGDVRQPANFEVLFGTPMNQLIEEAGGIEGKLRRLIVGGPMMGFAVPDAEAPVIKTSNCVLVDAGLDRELKTRRPAMPCIRCGSCMDVCPVRLLPQQLYWYSQGQEWEQAQEYSLFDCIECGCCDYVCPSHIPLVQYYRYAKGQIWLKEQEKQKSDVARQRHEFRQMRLEREKAERAARHKQKTQALAGEKAEGAAPKEADKEAKQAAILAAMERAKAKKAAQGVTPKNVDNLTDAQLKQIAEADARRAAAKTEPQSPEQEPEEKS